MPCGDAAANVPAARPPSPEPRRTVSLPISNVLTGGGILLTVTAPRLDGSSGPIMVAPAGLPAGRHATARTIDPEEIAAALTLSANVDVPAPQAAPFARPRKPAASKAISPGGTAETVSPAVCQWKCPVCRLTSAGPLLSRGPGRNALLAAELVCRSVKASLSRSISARSARARSWLYRVSGTARPPRQTAAAARASYGARAYPRGRVLAAAHDLDGGPGKLGAGARRASRLIHGPRWWRCLLARPAQVRTDAIDPLTQQQKAILAAGLAHTVLVPGDSKRMAFGLCRFWLRRYNARKNSTRS